MRSTPLTVLCLGLAVLTAGCVSAPPPEAPTAETAAPTIQKAAETTAVPVTETPAAETARPSETIAVTETTEPPFTAVLPVLSLQTEEQGNRALDFVTRPVAPHVAREWASWNPGARLAPEPYYAPCTVTLTDTDGTSLLPPVSADVKVRGNWTTFYEKKPLRIKFSEKQNLLGLHGGEPLKNWVLLAEYKDASFLRNKTALAIARGILEPDGLYAADAALTEVKINGEYWGVYLATEQQQVNPHRIAVTKPEADSTDTHIGYFLEYDGYYYTEDDLHAFLCDYEDNAPLRPFEGDDDSGRMIRPLNTGGYDLTKDTGITIKSDIYTQEQHDFIAAYVSNVYRILYRAAYQNEAWVFNAEHTEITKADISPEESVRQAIDVQSLADMYLIQEIACDADIYWSSFFMDVDFGEGGDGRLRFEAPWDFDSAMGNKDRCADGTGFYAANIVPDVNDQYDTINPWLAVLMHEEWFQKIVRQTWTRAYEAGIFEQACQEILHDADTFSEAFARDFARWDSLRNEDVRNELNSRAASCRTQKKAAEWLESWLRTRIAFLDDYWHMPESTE
ncbi:MAG: CotH kinase family protein [Oscillospiraceae bacterium]|nr:CotH kinase family protein [Oscillospiraceae bacterium]